MACELEEKLSAEVDVARDVGVVICSRAEAFQTPGLIRAKVSLPPEGLTEIRTVKIVDLDLQADGNTHRANTR